MSTINSNLTLINSLFLQVYLRFLGFFQTDTVHPNTKEYAHDLPEIQHWNFFQRRVTRMRTEAKQGGHF